MTNPRHRLAAALAASAVFWIGGATALESTRIGGGGRGGHVEMGHWPDARGAAWSPRRGPGAARKTLDLCLPSVSPEEVEMLRRLHARGVTLRVVVHDGGAADRASDRAIATLVREGIAIHRHAGPGSAGGFAVVDGELLIAPAPLSGGAPAEAFMAMVEDDDIAGAFAKHHEALVAAATAVRPEPGGVDSASSPSPPAPSPPAEASASTIGRGPTSKAPTDVYAVFGLSDLEKALAREGAEGIGYRNTGPPTLYLYAGAGSFRSGENDEDLPRLLAPLLARVGGSVTAIRAIVDRELPEAELRAWLTKVLPGRPVRTSRARGGVATGFALLPDGPWPGGITFLGTPEAGLVIRGLTAAATPFRPLLDE